jgi:hypothetical protein
MRKHHSSSRPTPLLGLVVVLCLGSLRASAQQPYEILAVYEPATDSSGLKRISLPITPGKVLPDGGLSHRLDRIVARFPADDGSRKALHAFEKMKFTVRMGEQDTQGGIKRQFTTKEIIEQPDHQVTLLAWKGDQKSTPVSYLNVEVQAVYSKDYLCLQEQLLIERRQQGSEEEKDLVTLDRIDKMVSVKPRRKSQASPANNGAGSRTETEDVCEPGETGRACKGSNRVLLKGEEAGPLLLYSFCKLQPAQLVDYKQLINSSEEQKKIYIFGQDKVDTDADLLSARYKQELSALVASQINEFFPPFAQAQVDKQEAGSKDALINVKTVHSFRIVKRFATHLYLEEAGGTVKMPGNPNESAANKVESIDHDSKLVVSLNDGLCTELSDDKLLMAAPWKLQLEVPDNKDSSKTKNIDVELDHRQPCSHVLSVNWKEYLDKDVTLRVLYHAHGEEDILLFQERFHVYNLGLITTVPVISEITSALQGDSPRDIEATSSIPVSWALPVRKNRKASVAVTFPFTVSLNTREMPNLAEYVALAPSISVIAGGPEDEEGENEDDVLRLGIGIGVNVARAFHFGYAWTPEDGGRYILLGVSVPELFPLLKGL